MLFILLGLNMLLNFLLGEKKLNNKVFFLSRGLEYKY